MIIPNFDYYERSRSSHWKRTPQVAQLIQLPRQVRLFRFPVGGPSMWCQREWPRSSRLYPSRCDNLAKLTFLHVAGTIRELAGQTEM